MGSLMSEIVQSQLVELFSQAIKLTTSELGYTRVISEILGPIPEDEQERELLKRYEILLYNFAQREWESRIEQSRMILAAIVQHKERRALQYMTFDSNSAIAEPAIAMLEGQPANSTTRQFNAFYRNNLGRLDAAGVDPQKTTEVLGKPDKFVLNTSRALAKVERDTTLTNVEKNDKTAEIIDDALTFPHASDLQKKYLAGRQSIPCDVTYLDDGTQLITFVCENPEQAIYLNKVTADCRITYGNVMPALRGEDRLLASLRAALAIVQSGQLDRLSTVDSKIVKVLKEYGMC